MMDIRTAMVRAEDRSANDRSHRARVHVVSGEVEIAAMTTAGRAEVFTTIPFPAEFTEKPHIDLGFSVRAGTPIASGALPSASAIVNEGRWETKKRSELVPHYKAVEVLCVLEGSPGTRFTLLWRAEGMGFLL